MPKRMELREGMTVEIAGVPVVVVVARARRAVLAVGGFDADGLLETADAVKHTAARWRGLLDAAEPSGED